jgi:hypothetical protein
MSMLTMPHRRSASPDARPGSLRRWLTSPPTSTVAVAPGQLLPLALMVGGCAGDVDDDLDLVPISVQAEELERHLRIVPEVPHAWTTRPTDVARPLHAAS